MREERVLGTLSKAAVTSRRPSQEGAFMGEEVYIDLGIRATVEDEDYLVVISKADLNTLVTFSEDLVVRHWDGTNAVVLESYGDSAVRTKEDASSTNNLAGLPRISDTDLESILG